MKNENRDQSSKSRNDNFFLGRSSQFLAINLKYNNNQQGLKKMTKKKIVILLILILVLVIAGAGFWYFPKLQEKSNLQKENAITQAVLDSLEDSLEFCEVIKSDFQKEKSSFWLICNNRPFFAEYINGEVKYELNGWGFLKQDLVIWQDLENCDFYNSEKIDNNYNLTFYCPRNFQNVTELKTKTYLFNVQTTKIEKIKEEKSLDVINNDIKSIYPFLSECEIKNYSLKSYEIPVLFINYACDEEEWFVMSQALLSIQPPILINSKLSNKERAKISFERAFDCKAENISSFQPNSIAINSLCKDREFSVSYVFSDILYASPTVKCEKLCMEVGKYFIFPPIKDTDEINLIKELKNVTPGIFYKVGDNIVVIASQNSYISMFWQKWEKFYE